MKNVVRSCPAAVVGIGDFDAKSDIAIMFPKPP